MAPLTVIAREWLRIGLIGFGGPPAHISLLRDLVVRRKGWMDARAFEDANAACSLLPGPGSTQLAIFCAYRVGGPAGAVVGGLGFVLPAVLMVLALSLLFLASAPPEWVRGAGAGAGAAVAAVAVRAGGELVGPSYKHAMEGHGHRLRWVTYLLAGVVAAIVIGPYLVLVLVACGLFEVARRTWFSGNAASLSPAALVVGAASTGGIGALAWTAFKVGALSFGGGFVIIPLMQGDAVDVYHWMTDAQFLNAVALGQVTPGPVVATVTAVGYAAHGVGGALLAATVAFAPSFSFILLGGGRFERLRGNERARGFLDGAGPAAIGAILGSAVTLAGGISEDWQIAVLGGAAIALLVLRRSVAGTLVVAGAIGAVLALAGAPLP
ncbi:MAG TPA: chromate efflux transporter [Solirubrobacterales bacterium]|nr:chromate efflux transporter [Solirubrobacterales bacterium]